MNAILKSAIARLEKLSYELSVPEGRMSKVKLEMHMKRRSELIRKIRVWSATAMVFAILQPTIALASGIGVPGDGWARNAPLAWVESQHIKVVSAALPMTPAVTKEAAVGATSVVEFEVGPTAGYWDAVAQCETRQNWKDDGKWAGGLGIYTSRSFRDAGAGTWERWGGEEFAPRPDQATKFQQIIIANRIAVTGWSTYVVRDAKKAKIQGVPPAYWYIKEPVGFGGWGCIKDKYTKKWRIGRPKQQLEFTASLPVDQRYYCPEFEPLFYKYGLPVRLMSHVAWQVSRCNPLHSPDGVHYGLLQMNPALYSSGMAELGLVPADLGNAEKNIMLAGWALVNTKPRIMTWNSVVPIARKK